MMEQPGLGLGSSLNHQTLAVLLKGLAWRLEGTQARAHLQVVCFPSSACQLTFCIAWPLPTMPYLSAAGEKIR